ncbi:MAG TPA: SAM-dependent chlorinase/fluorinase [Bacteroidales bacterium]|nr:SAM-dependent chlorinase/fluorinase [Bacteroidales bacterium]
MTVVSLTSDWGLESHYTGTIKGLLHKLIPGVQIIDISHKIPPFSLLHTSFVLRNAYHWFPEGTIHLVCVNTEATETAPHIALSCQGHYFIGADNGLFSLLFEQNPDEVVAIEPGPSDNESPVTSREVFARTASQISKGMKLSQLGKVLNGPTQRFLFKPVVNPNHIIGKVIYVDEFENAYVNIDKPTFGQISGGRPFVINLGLYNDRIDELSEAYNDVPEGEKLARFGPTGCLEIAINRGKASSLLGLRLNDGVSIEFTDPT